MAAGIDQAHESDRRGALEGALNWPAITYGRPIICLRFASITNPGNKTARVKWKGYKTMTTEPLSEMKNTTAWAQYIETKTYKK